MYKMCTCMCTCSCACSMHIYGGQRTAEGVSPCLLPCFTKGSRCYSPLCKSSGPRASETLVSASKLAVGAWDCRCILPCLVYRWVLVFRLRSLILCGKHLTPLSHLPRLLHSFKNHGLMCLYLIWL